MKGSSDDSCSKIKILLRETIMALCRNGLSYDSKFSVEGLLGITLDDENVFLISIKENVIKENTEEQKCDSLHVEVSSPISKETDAVIPEKHTSKRRKTNQVEHDDIIKRETRTTNDDSANEEVELKDPGGHRFLIDSNVHLPNNSPCQKRIVNQSSKSSQVVPSKKARMSTPDIHRSNSPRHFLQRSSLCASKHEDALNAEGEWRSSGRYVNDRGQYGPLPRSLLKQRRSQLVPPRRSQISGYNPLVQTNLPQVSMTAEEDVALSRCILSTPGCFVSARSVQRKTHRWNSEQIMQGMIKLTRTQDDPLYVGEYKLVRSTVKVFYKCPPKLVRDEAFYRYDISKSQYEKLFSETARPSSSAPNAWESYLESILSVSPFVETMVSLPEFNSIIYSKNTKVISEGVLQIKPELHDYDSPFTHYENKGTREDVEVTLEATAPEDVPPVDQTITLETTPYQPYEHEFSKLQLSTTGGQSSESITEKEMGAT